MEDILTKLIKQARDLQPWPNYFESKMREFKAVLHFHSLAGSVNSVLEIGCGNGFTSCLLSRKARRVIAFDLPVKDAGSHSLGIDVTRELIRRADIKNVSIVGGSADTLPFSNNAFDLIFSAYALQYVRQKEKALTDMYRVLRPEGIVIAIVPNFVERIAAPIIKWEYLLKKILFHIVGGRREKIGQTTGSCDCSSFKRRPVNIPEILNDWFLLKPDGAYRSFVEEMIRHTPGFWKRLFENSGFRVINIFSAELLPLGIFEILGVSSSRFISKKSFSLNKALGNVPVLRYLSYSLCLVSTKD